MITPTIHLNGTSRDSLLTGYRNAYDAVDDAISALKQTAPHGRDYYVQGDNVITAAVSEHFARLNALESVKTQLETICLAIMD